MDTPHNITINQTDFLKLSSLIKTAPSEVADLLEEELSRATVVPDKELPHDVVSMNSRVSFQDMETGKESIVTLVYPHDANIEESKISVLTPVGSALIGLKVGDDIQWPFPHGKQKKLKVISVTAERTVSVNGVTFTHNDIFNVVDDFYTRIQRDPVLQVPFKSVGDWPEHIQKLTHFWWIRFGGKPYLLNYYNPVAKHFFAGFNRELLARWLFIFHETLQVHLTPEQVKLWKMVSERMGEGLFMKNELFRKEYES